MLSQDYSQQSVAHAFSTTNNQLLGKNREVEEPFSQKDEMVRRSSGSSEHSGDELFYMDDARGEGSIVVVPRNARDEIIRMQSFTESDEEYRCDEIVVDRPNDGPKRENQIIEPQNHFNHIECVRGGKTVRDLIERNLEFSTESQISVWEDVLIDLRRKEEEDTRFVLDTNEAKHLQFRVPLVEWILDVCAEAQFGPATADVAIEYMVRVFLRSFSPCVARALDRSLRVVFVCLFSLFPFVLNGVWQPVSSLLSSFGKKRRKRRKYLVQMSPFGNLNLEFFLPFFRFFRIFMYRERRRKK